MFKDATTNDWEILANTKFLDIENIFDPTPTPWLIENYDNTIK